MFWLKEDNKQVRVFAAVGLIVLLVCRGASTSWALGTPAGTVISTTATVNYTLGADPAPLSASATGRFTVLEVIDAQVVWQDAAPVQVNTPHTGRCLSFLLTNTGNGPERFGLIVDQALAGDDFDPVAGALWLETNGTAGLQIGASAPDTPYTPGLNDPELAADAARLIYLLSNIPSGLIDGQQGQARLTAAALTPGASGSASGTPLPGAGPGGIDAVVGGTGAGGAAVGTYAVTAVEVTLTKQILRIADTYGGNEPYPGATVTYRIRVDINGSGTARDLVISDLVPAGMTYVGASLLLDGHLQTDADDPPVDSSDFNITAADTVTVNLGDRVAPATHLIDFQTTID